MLVVFSSPATESITMFNDAAVELLKLMGATGKIPGALSAPDLPPAIAKLEASLDRIRKEGHGPAAPTRADAASEDKEDQREREPPVGIATRAVPLLDLMKRAAAANAALVWEPRR